MRRETQCPCSLGGSKKGWLEMTNTGDRMTFSHSNAIWGRTEMVGKNNSSRLLFWGGRVSSGLNRQKSPKTTFKNPCWGAAAGCKAVHGKPTCCAGRAWRWVYGGRACLCTCVGVRARVLESRVPGPCVRLGAVRARVRPACARAWRRRARDLAAVVRARRSARPPAGAQHRLRPGVCMRGVSERVGGPGGVGCGEQPRGAAVPRTPWHRAQPPCPTAGIESAAGAGRRPLLSPAAGRGPGGCGRDGEAGSGGACQRPDRIPRVLLPGCGPQEVAAEGRGPPGGRPAALEEPREQKETATAPPWSKQPELAAAQGPAAASERCALTPSPLRSPTGPALRRSRRGAEAGRGPRRPRAALAAPPPRVFCLPRPLAHLDSWQTCQLTAT